MFLERTYLQLINLLAQSDCNYKKLNEALEKPQTIAALTSDYLLSNDFLAKYVENESSNNVAKRFYLALIQHKNLSMAEKTAVLDFLFTLLTEDTFEASPGGMGDSYDKPFAFEEHKEEFPNYKKMKRVTFQLSEKKDTVAPQMLIFLGHAESLTQALFTSSINPYQKAQALTFLITNFKHDGTIMRICECELIYEDLVHALMIPQWKQAAYRKLMHIEPNIFLLKAVPLLLNQTTPPIQHLSYIYFHAHQHKLQLKEADQILELLKPNAQYLPLLWDTIKTTHSEPYKLRFCREWINTLTSATDIVQTLDEIKAHLRKDNFEECIYKHAKQAVLRLKFVKPERYGQAIIPFLNSKAGWKGFFGTNTNSAEIAELITQNKTTKAKELYQAEQSDLDVKFLMRGGL